jgi:hypothetical protein
MRGSFLAISGSLLTFLSYQHRCAKSKGKTLQMRKSLGRTRTFTDEQVSGALARRAEGLSWKEAAASIGISVSRLQNRAAELKGQPYPSSSLFDRTLKRHGLTLAQYEEMVAAQGGRCPLCDSTPSRLVIDHSVSARKVRGLLCAPCNGMLGRLEKGTQFASPAWLKNALRYLKERGSD